MWNKIKNWFSKKSESYISKMVFKDNVKALAIELYKDVSIIYLSHPKAGKEQGEYRFFYGKENYIEEADTLENLMTLAHDKIDSLK